MQNKTKYYVLGSSLVLAAGMWITGPSEEQVQATAQKEGYTPKPVIPVKMCRPLATAPRSIQMESRSKCQIRRLIESRHFNI